jgi:hypothetical protein
MPDDVRGACCRAGNSAVIYTVAAVEASHTVLEDRCRGWMHMGASRVPSLGAAAPVHTAALTFCRCAVLHVYCADGWILRSARSKCNFTELVAAASPVSASGIGIDRLAAAVGQGVRAVDARVVDSSCGVVQRIECACLFSAQVKI